MNHLSLAHLAWEKHLKPGAKVIDATVGNGHDTLILAKMALADSKGHLLGFDIQEKAINRTRARLEENLTPEQLLQIKLIHGSHEAFSGYTCSADLIVYNLGYLPGGDKSITTLSESTINSLLNAKLVLSKEGLISLTCYPGHIEGEKEAKEVEKLLTREFANSFTISSFKRVNSHKSPILYLLHNNR